MHSAVRVDGKRLYQLARQGIEIERAARRIEIMELRREAFVGDELVVSVACSKGTYIRTLARDVGRSLGCGAYLTGLRRTAVGGFALEQAKTLDELASDPAPAARLLPVDVLVAGVPRWECDPDGARRFSQGQEIDGPDLPEGAELAVFGVAGRFVGVGRMAPARRLAPLRLMSPRAEGESPDFA
jgi:tRNA pseudouridine55 synthase